MKIHFPSNLYRYASITLAGTLTTGAILFRPDLQTFASSQNSLTASHSDANRDDFTPSPIYQPLALHQMLNTVPPKTGMRTMK